VKKSALIGKLVEDEPKDKKIKKKRRLIESDDEEEVVIAKPIAKKELKRKKEDDSAKPAKKIELGTKDIGSLFGGPVKRTERSKIPHVSPKKTSSTTVSNEMKEDNDLMIAQLAIAEDEVKKDSPGKENRKETALNETPSVPEVKVKKEETKKAKSDETPRPPVTVKSSSTSSLSTSKKQQVIPANPRAVTLTLDDFSFVDKYKPTTMKQVIGQQGPQSNGNKLQQWLLNWDKNHGAISTKVARANPYSKNSDGSSFRAALLSGSPGVGKTTTAHLVAKECLYDIVEFNASDTRSKKLLKEEVSQLLANKSLKGYLTGDEKTVSKRHVLIMDEVDGMAGNEDRGGVAELIQLIKESRIPIICMCNDRAHPKIRSLVNYCFDLRFLKPSTNQIRSAMMSICFKEGMKMEPGAIDAIISGTGNDVRQTLNHLALYSAKKSDQKISTDSAKKTAQMSEKDIKIVCIHFFAFNHFFNLLFPRRVHGM
jgi:replication factor C subunit 1